MSAHAFVSHVRLDMLFVHRGPAVKLLSVEHLEFLEGFAILPHFLPLHLPFELPLLVIIVAAMALLLHLLFLDPERVYRHAAFLQLGKQRLFELLLINFISFMLLDFLVVRHRVIGQLLN